MEIETRNRTDLKKYFVKNSIPTENNFSELVDAMLNQKDDGIVKAPGAPLAIEAAGGPTSQKKAINFYDSFADTAAAWVVALNPRTDPLDASMNKEGFSLSDSDGYSRLFIDKATGYVGLGTIEPDVPLHVGGGTAAALSGGGFLVVGDTAAANLALGDGAIMARNKGQLSTLDLQQYGGELLVHGNGNAPQKFVVKDDGKVGIGTSSPKTTLSVIGALRGADAVNEADYVEVGHDGTDGYVDRAGGGRLDFRLDGSSKMSIQFDGTVGIGTTGTGGYQLRVLGKGNFTGALDVGGALSVTGDGTIGGDLSFGTTPRQMINLVDTRYGIGVQDYTTYFRTSRNFAWYKGGIHSDTQYNPGTDGNVQMVIDTTGNVGIGTKNPSHKLEVAGTGNSTGGWTQSSDAVSKTNVRGLGKCLDKVLALTGVRFNWKDPARDQSGQVGLIAQEVEKVFPELVGLSGEEKCLNYSGLIAPLIEAIREQQERIEALEASQP